MINTKFSSSIITTYNESLRDDSPRKNKQNANKDKKPFSLNKNMTSSIINKNIKDENHLLMESLLQIIIRVSTKLKIE